MNSKYTGQEVEAILDKANGSFFVHTNGGVVTFLNSQNGTLPMFIQRGFAEGSMCGTNLFDCHITLYCYPEKSSQYISTSDIDGHFNIDSAQSGMYVGAVSNDSTLSTKKKTYTINESKSFFKLAYRTAELGSGNKAVGPFIVDLYCQLPLTEAMSCGEELTIVINHDQT